MPRPRLTLGRLMAWIAFAAVNLAVLGIAYRPTQRSGVIVGVLILLVPINLVAAFCYRRAKAIREALAGEAGGGPDTVGDHLALLIIAALALVAFGAMLVGAMTPRDY